MLNFNSFKRMSSSKLIKKLNSQIVSYLEKIDTRTYYEIFYWAIIILVILSIPIIFHLHCKGIIIGYQQTEALSESIFSNSLAFIFSIIGFMIALIIFFIEYYGKRIESQELEKYQISNYYVTIPLLGCYVIYNFICLYLELGYPYALLSLVFSISVIFLVGINILDSLHMMKTSNLINNISNQIILFIKKRKSFEKIPSIGEVEYSSEFISSLNTKTSSLFRASKDAIKKGKDELLKSTLQGIGKIAHIYLDESKHLNSTRDIFLNELNDQFNFIIDEALVSYNQKILEDIAKTIGDISLNIVRYRKGIGNIHQFAIPWLSTLKRLFTESYCKDRTTVCQICLENINNVILLTLHRGYYESYTSYKMFLDQISNTLAQKNEYWAAILLQKSLSMYRKHFVTFLVLAKSNKIVFNKTFVRTYFDKLAQIVNTAKMVHLSFGNSAVLFASLYGMYPFVQDFIKLELNNLDNNRLKQNICIYINEFIKFNQKVTEIDSNKNDNRVYETFPETLYLITCYIDLLEEDRNRLVLQLSLNWFEYIEKRYLLAVGNTDVDVGKLEDNTIDYFALLIYFYNDKPNLVKGIFQRFVDIYLKIKSRIEHNDDHISKSLHEDIKLFSCWIDIYPNLEEINIPFIELLRKNFYEPEFPGRISIPTLFEKYGYPRNRLSHITGIWYIRPSYMWGSAVQKSIGQKLNSPEGKHYIEFHKKLKLPDHE